VFNNAATTEVLTEVIILHEIVGRDQTFDISSNMKTTSAPTPKISKGKPSGFFNTMRSVKWASQVFGVW
jgi:hypothetical protein